MSGFTYTLVLASILGAGTTAPDLTALTPSQRVVFGKVVGEEFCDCTSSLSLAGCLDLRKDCRMAHHLAEIVFEQVQLNRSSDQILGTLSNRVFAPFCGPQKKGLTPALPFKGNPDAPVTLIEFADFRCPHCKMQAPALKTFARQYAQSVKVIFVPFPLNDHPLSVAASEALLAANAQGRFWEMHDLLFAHPDGNFDHPTLIKLAKKANLKLKQFNRDLKEHRYRDQVQELKALGLRAGIAGTPSFFMNGRPFVPDSTTMTLARRLEMELDRGLGTCQ